MYLSVLLQWASTFASGPEFISLQPTQTPYQQACAFPGGQCNATILVYGFTASRYTLTASIGVINLPDSQPINAAVGANAYVYFQYTTTNAVPLTISVTPITGDPDLFVSTINQRPSSGSNQWFSNGFGNEAVYIVPTDPKLRNCSSPCTFYIAVFGWSNPATFTIMASTSTVAGTLVPGTPQVGM